MHTPPDKIGMTKLDDTLKLRRLGIDTHQEAVIYMHRDCHICRSEGFSSHVRVQVTIGDETILATVNLVEGNLLSPNEASLSEIAWRRLSAREGGAVTVEHPHPLDSLSRMRAKVYGHRLGDGELAAIMHDIVAGSYSDIHLSSFITACAATGLDHAEIVGLTRAMVGVGERLDWGSSVIVDKHCVGGLPGNRTTPIVVAIMAASGLTMPKTSSRAITSPAGTADMMEVLAPVDLDIIAMRRVVESEGGCVVWGGSVSLSPADDTLIRVERALDLDSEGQLVASVLSKKVAAGSSTLVIDMPVGPTAKVRSDIEAERLANNLISVSKAVGLNTKVLWTDGTQPVGRGIGPALEAFDVLAVLRGSRDAPVDLRERALDLAGVLLELASAARSGAGREMARCALDTGAAWRKFQAICEAQGGMRLPMRAAQQLPIHAEVSGRVVSVDNRRLAMAAKLAGAPESKAAGIEFRASLGAEIENGDALFVLHADSVGEIAYADEYIKSHSPIVGIERSS